jgi:hypothetical protein
VKRHPWLELGRIPAGRYDLERPTPSLKPTPCWRNRCPDLKNSLPTAALSTPRHLAQSASAGAATAGSDQASRGRRQDISINSISAASALPNANVSQNDLLNPRRWHLRRHRIELHYAFISYWRPGGDAANRY